jgi:hypothetical protein
VRACRVSADPSEPANQFPRLALWALFPVVAFDLVRIPMHYALRNVFWGTWFGFGSSLTGQPASHWPSLAAGTFLHIFQGYVLALGYYVLFRRTTLASALGYLFVMLSALYSWLFPRYVILGPTPLKWYFVLWWATSKPWSGPPVPGFTQAQGRLPGAIAKERRWAGALYRQAKQPRKRKGWKEDAIRQARHQPAAAQGLRLSRRNAQSRVAVPGCWRSNAPGPLTTRELFTCKSSPAPVAVASTATTASPSSTRRSCLSFRSLPGPPARPGRSN